MTHQKSCQVCEEMEQQLRSCLLKLLARLSEIHSDPKISDSLSFSLRIRTNRAGAEALSSDTKWCAIEPTKNVNRDRVTKQIIPVHYVSSPFSMRLSIEL